ncbi:hypothetical protein ACFHW2_24555 [Actinomadura sp. LOL_016]|uniref:hypothetical protein n=1 Tax=unclassified Actinomadura TaxID=2626254 RepID=UPI003A8104D8
MDSPNPHRPVLARRPLLIVGLLAAAWGGFSTLGMPDVPPAAGVPLGMAAGLLWTGVAALVARPLLRRRARAASRAPEVAALLAALGAELLFGPGLYTHLTYLTGESYLGLMMSEDPGAAYVYFMVLNPLMEWLIIPVAVLLNWSEIRRRTLVVVGASVYFAVRAWTYLYFAPTALSWQNHAGETPTQAQIDQAQTWLNLDWPRMALDLTVGVCFAAPALLPRRSGPSLTHRDADAPAAAQATRPAGA